MKSDQRAVARHQLLVGNGLNTVLNSRLQITSAVKEWQRRGLAATGKAWSEHW
jgi:hypothetical protein